MKKQISWHLPAVFTIIIATAAFTVITCKFTSEVLINLSFILLMFLIVFFDYIFFLSQAKVINKDFDNAKEKINAHSHKEYDLEDFLNEKNLFKNKSANHAFDEYKKEVRRIYSKDHASIIPDIKDYFNEELIDTVVRTEISEQISGAMTGIGILGTFVGLTIGLGKFSLGSDIDTTQMQESISGLLGGIKTAFMTSIFGVVYSLLFNFFYKRIYIQAYESMTDFVSCFENELVSSPQNDLLTSFVRNQEIQTDSLSKFAENIAAALTQQMNDLLRPTMDYFNTSVDRFLEKSVYTHNESLEAIVSAFIDNMNASMGNQFEALGKTIAELNANQISNNEKIQQVVDSICQNASDIATVNNSLENSINVMSRFIERIDGYQASMDQANERLLERINVINGYNDRQAEILTNMEKSQEDFNQTAERIRQSLEEFNRISSDFSEKSEKSYKDLTNTVGIAFESMSTSINSFGELNNAFISEIRTTISDELKNMVNANAEQCKVYTDAMTRIVDSANNRILESAESSEKIITEAFTNVKSIIDGISNISGEQSKDLVESAKAIAEESRTAIESCKTALEGQAKITETAMTDIIRSASEAIAKINTSSEEQNKQIIESFTRAVSESQKILDTQISKANEISENMSINMTRSASALDKAYKELENDISKVLHTTFDSFDSGMADISSHLSGTIKSNEKSIEKLNEYMEEVPVKLYAIIDKMMKELTITINELKKIRTESIEMEEFSKGNNK